MKTQLEILLEQIHAQMKAVEERSRIMGWNGVNPFEIQNSDGSFPMIPLLLAKAEVLNSMTLLTVNETQIIWQAPPGSVQ